jgi:tRNA A-37 threonylcarbamoyl transferase component Bud32
VHSAVVTSTYRLATAWDHPAARGFCDSIDAMVDSLPAEAVIHDARNTVYRCHALGSELVVKRFSYGKRWPQRLISDRRPSKAVRSFAIAERLLAARVPTPEPIAAVDRRQGDHLVRAYYCCRHLAHDGSARDLQGAAAGERTPIIRALGHFAAFLHGQGILHRDFNSSNVLIVQRGRPQPEFFLIDLNRIRFGRVGALRGLYNLLLLGFRGEDAGVLLDGYCAGGRGWRGQRGLFALFAHIHALIWAVKKTTRPLRRRCGL